MIKKPRKKVGQIHFLTPFFNFPGSPPWKLQKIDFPIWNLHLNWPKLPEVLVIFWFFSFFDPKNHFLTIFDPKNQKTPKKFYPPPVFDVITKPKPTTLCLAMFLGFGICLQWKWQQVFPLKPIWNPLKIDVITKPKTTTLCLAMFCYGFVLWQGKGQKVVQKAPIIGVFQGF